MHRGAVCVLLFVCVCVLRAAEITKTCFTQMHASERVSKRGP